ncbi:uncharacterized protein LOC132269232 isoform X2 [Cornus florida]|uniref:uncharacterized protein LOC132269232 isoform X2 n=1 Tax=Cornus florida TaxID=4283 RepID=UPI0028A12F47|nr:uncharacterized protein LOC132269232 isoform X2 [Cornus florida]
MDVPRWFFDWWQLFGPCKEIIPDFMSKGFSIFQEKFQAPSELLEFPKLFLFFANFALSWIVQWQFQILISPSNLPLLGRIFKVKWWDQFSIKNVTPEAISEWFSKHPAISCSGLGESSTFLLFKSQTQGRLSSARSKDEYEAFLLDALAQVNPIAFSQMGSNRSDGGASSFHGLQTDQAQANDEAQANEDDCFGKAKRKGGIPGEMTLSKNDNGSQQSLEMVSEVYKFPLAWIDLEMTGLDVEVDRILEIACVITDGNLTKAVEGPDLVIHQSKECLDRMGEWCESHHGASGLTEKVLQSTITEREAEKQVIEFVKRYGRTHTPLLAGNSVYMDLRFLKKYMPDLAALFSHVLVDVSSIKALCIRWYPRDKKKAPSKENKHRAMDDIKESIAELKFYKENIFKSKPRR